jgi:hypothetical protein
MSGGWVCNESHTLQYLCLDLGEAPLPGSPPRGVPATDAKPAAAKRKMHKCQVSGSSVWAMHWCDLHSRFAI